MNSTVYINGIYLGNRPYGFSTFEYDLTPNVKYGDQENVIAVKVDHSLQPSCRWYTGSGINRNAHEGRIMATIKPTKSGVIRVEAFSEGIVGAIKTITAK